MNDLFQIGLETLFKENGDCAYYSFPPCIIISENHPLFIKIVNLLIEEKDNNE